MRDSDPNTLTYARTEIVQGTVRQYCRAFSLKMIIMIKKKSWAMCNSTATDAVTQ